MGNHKLQQGLVVEAIDVALTATVKNTRGNFVLGSMPLPLKRFFFGRAGALSRALQSNV